MSDKFRVSGRRLTFDTQRANLVKVRVVDMGIHSEQSPQDSSTDLQEIGRKTYSNLLREDALIIQFGLGPCHEGLDVCWSRKSSWPFTVV